MKIITITSRLRNYNIYAGKRILKNICEIFKETAPGARAFIIADTNTGALYLKQINELLSQSGTECISVTIPFGESSKNMETVQMLLKCMFDNGMTRSDAVIALGGGVVGDISGFAASLYMRGIKLIQIPTSLLAQVDSSIGGKTGIDTAYGKNLIGTFYPPHAVLTDFELLNTLPEREFACGMAEIIKSAAIMDEKLFERLESGCDIEDMVLSSLNIKKTVVEEDELEKSSRRLLNFGHTLGHGIETYYGYNGKVLHGEAIAAGMAKITSKCVENGICDNETYDRLISVLKKYKLPVEFDYDPLAVQKHMQGDKKAENSVINLVVLKKIGQADIIKVNKNDLLNWIM
jgi:3-dehydroquinate synthase